MGKAIEFETEIEIGEDEVLCRVSGTFTRGYRAVLYLSNGDPGHPGEPNSAEVDRIVRLDTGAEIEVSDEVVRELADRMVEEHDDRAGEDYEPDEE